MSWSRELNMFLYLFLVILIQLCLFVIKIKLQFYFCLQVSISSTFTRTFLPIFWRQKISNPKQNLVTFGAKISAQNACIKCWCNRLLSFSKIYQRSLVQKGLICLGQWFPTGVPRHTRVSWGGARGAAKYWIMGLFSMFYYLGYLR